MVIFPFVLDLILSLHLLTYCLRHLQKLLFGEYCLFQEESGKNSSLWRRTKISAYHICWLNLPVSNIQNITSQKTCARIVCLNLHVDRSW